jgi:hypothetical protein
MESIFLTLGILLGGILAWWRAQSIERAKHVSRAQDLESKTRLAQGETLKLKEQVVKMNGEMAALRSSLDEERQSKTQALVQLALSFKKGLLALTTGYLAIGIIVGGTTGWLGAQAQNNHQPEMTQAQTKVEMYEKQIERLQYNFDANQIILLKEREEKAIAQAKLAILLESLSPKKGPEGFELDYAKLKEKLQNQASSESSRPLLFPSN